MGKRRPPALSSPRGEGGIRRSHARRMTDEVSCREGRGMLPQTAQGLNSFGFSTAAEIACWATEPVRSGDRTPCGARKTLRAYACPPCRIAIPGPAPRRPANGAAAEIAASLLLPQAARGRNSSGFSTAAEIACGATEPVRSGDERLAVPEKPFGLTLILRFFDRCGNCGLASSAAGSARPQFLIILNSGGGDCFLLVTCGIVCPSKDETEKRREDAC